MGSRWRGGWEKEKNREKERQRKRGLSLCDRNHNCGSTDKPKTVQTPAMAKKPGAAQTPKTSKNAQNSINAKNSTHAKHNTKPGMAQNGNQKRHKILTKFKPNSILKGLLPTGRNLFLPPMRRRLTPSLTMAPAKTGGDRHHSAKYGALSFFDGAAAVRATIIGDFKLWSFYHNMQMRFMHNSTNAKTITS